MERPTTIAASRVVGIVKKYTYFVNVVIGESKITQRIDKNKLNEKLEYLKFIFFPI